MRPIKLLGIFKAVTVFAALCFLQVILGADAASAGTSVDGFFPDDYVKTGHFSATSQDAISPNAKTGVSETSSGVRAPVHEAVQGENLSNAVEAAQVSGVTPVSRAAPASSVIPTAPQGYRGSPQQPVSRVRGYPGRFVKSTRGVEGHRVRGDASDPSTEWDVSSRLPAR